MDDATLAPLGAREGSRWQVNRTHADLTRPPRPVRRVDVEAQPKSLALDLGRTAMVVVDMQNDFCTRGGWLDHIGVDFSPARRPIAPLQRLLPALRGADVPVIWVNWGNRPDKLNLSPCLLHVYNGDGRSVGIGDPLPGSGAPVLQKDSWAAAVVDELEIAPADVRVDKFRMSGFWDTPLDAILRNLGVTTLLFGGVNADQCVLATLMDANFLGYDTILVEDCSATTSPAYCWDATLYNVRVCFGFTVTSDALMKGLA
jgi:nicotinamidase-related amidase